MTFLRQNACQQKEYKSQPALFWNFEGLIDRKKEGIYKYITKYKVIQRTIIRKRRKVDEHLLKNITVEIDT